MKDGTTGVEWANPSYKEEREKERGAMMLQERRKLETSLSLCMGLRPLLSLFLSSA